MESKLRNRIFFSPEDITLFNSARLLVLLDVLENLNVKNGIDMERLSYYDFFAANPFLIINKQDPLWLDLAIAGFEINTLGYISSSQRYRTKRSCLKQYLSLLLSKSLIKVSNIDKRIFYKITPLGIETVSKIESMYAIAYRKSIEHIVKRFKDCSDHKLWEDASEWLEAKTFQVDLMST
jgi:hypothetical protein